MALQLHNTMTRRLEPFVPLEDRVVRMYVCGPTVYDRAHIGHAMSAVVFDVENDGRHGVADVRAIVDGRATDVHADDPVLQGHKGLQAAGHRIVQLQCHSIYLPPCHLSSPSPPGHYSTA